MDRKFLVSTEWLATHLDDGNTRVVDGSWYLPTMNRDAVAEYEVAHIPGAVHFQIDEVADTSSGLPHMLATPEIFASAVGRMGICCTDTIIVYDGAGLFSAPRVWWNFKVMGAQNVFILDGGLPKWQAEGRRVESGSVMPKPAEFSPAPIKSATASSAEISAISSTGDIQIVDMRPADRFAGAAPEPRPGLRSGHIPGSINLPFQNLLDEGRLKPAPALRSAVLEAGIDLAKPIVTSCGSGVTAAFLNLALAELGIDALRIYDGSWADWGADSTLPIEIG